MKKLFLTFFFASKFVLSAMESNQKPTNQYVRFDQSFYSMEKGTPSGSIHRALIETIKNANKEGRSAQIIEFGPGSGLSTVAHIEAILKECPGAQFTLHIYENCTENQEKIQYRLLKEKKFNRVFTPKKQPTFWKNGASVILYKKENANVVEGIKTLQEGSIDLLYSYYALHCLTPKQQVELYPKLNRVLKQNSQIVATVQNPRDTLTEEEEVGFPFDRMGWLKPFKPVKTIQELEKSGNSFPGYMSYLTSISDTEWNKFKDFFSTISLERFAVAFSPQSSPDYFKQKMKETNNKQIQRNLSKNLELYKQLEELPTGVGVIFRLLAAQENLTQEQIYKAISNCSYTEKFLIQFLPNFGFHVDKMEHSQEFNKYTFFTASKKNEPSEESVQRLHTEAEKAEKSVLDKIQLATDWSKDSIEKVRKILEKKK